MQSIFLLWHTHIDVKLDGGEDIKLIGVYSTEDLAHKALLRFLNTKGFKDYPDGFEISEYKLDQDHWTNGFITV